MFNDTLGKIHFGWLFLAYNVTFLPGFGQTDRPNWIVTVRDLAAWVAWFVRDMNLAQPLNVVGISMGGWVAVEIAIMNQHIFKKMMLVAPAGLKAEDGETWDYFAKPA